MYVCVCDFFFFFFSSRRRHTRFDCDWSSDVCSSDLLNSRRHGALRENPDEQSCLSIIGNTHRSLGTPRSCYEIGRASCRERGVDLGGRRIIKKKKKKKRSEVVS